MCRIGWKPVAIAVFLCFFFLVRANAQTYVQSQTNAVGSSGNNTATFSAQPSAGDTVVAGVVCYGPSNCTVSSVTDNFSNTYTKIGPTASYGGPTQNVTNVMLYCASGISSGSSFTVTANQSNSGGGDSNLYIAEYSGASCTVDQSASGSLTGGTATTLLQTSSATTTNPSDLLVAVGGSSAGGNATAGSGYHLRQNATPGVAENGGFEDETVASTGSYSASMNMASSTTYWAMVMVALKGSSGSGSPTITSFSPTSGAVGTSVNITGTNFTGATALKFNGTGTSFTVNSSTQITATVPSGATTGTISVSTPSGTGTSSSSFTVTGSGGSIAYVQSQTNAVGSSGNNTATFSASPTAGDTIVAGVVCYGPNVCQITSVTDNFGNPYSQIGPTAMYGGPTTNGTPVALYCASGISSGSSFTVTANQSNSGGGDSNLYIAEYSGASCTVDQSASGSLTGGTATTLLQTSSATTTNSSDLLVAVGGSSAGGNATAGSGYHLRQNATPGVAENGGFEDETVASTGSYSGSMTMASSTTYWAMVMVALKGSSSGGATPTVTSFSPTSGAVGTSVTITGTNLTGAASVKFNGTAATSFTVNSSTQITTTVPSGATTGTISVTTPSGTGTSSTSFTITTSGPTITSVSPTGASDGTTVTISGVNFGSAQGTVTFGSASATVQSWNATTIVTSVPLSLLPSFANIQITTSTGSASNSFPFTVTAPGCPAN